MYTDDTEALDRWMTDGGSPEAAVAVRVLVLREGPAFVALALDGYMRAQAASLFLALEMLGVMFDARDKYSLTVPPAPASYAERYAAGIDLGETQLGERRRCTVRLLLSSSARS